MIPKNHIQAAIVKTTLDLVVDEVGHYTQNGVSVRDHLEKLAGFKLGTQTKNDKYNNYSNTSWWVEVYRSITGYGRDIFYKTTLAEDKN